MDSVGGRFEPEISTVKEYKPSRQEMLRDHEIRIEFLSIGCIIRVGCKSIPFTNVDEGMAELNEYVKNPYESRQKWEKIFNQ